MLPNSFFGSTNRTQQTLINILGTVLTLKNQQTILGTVIALKNRKKSIMIEENNTNITKNHQINFRAERIDDPELAIAVVDEIDVVAEEPALAVDNANSAVIDVVAQPSVVGNSPAVPQSNTYQTMIEASIQTLQHSVSLQQQLTLNSYTTTTENLDFINSKERRVAGNNTTDKMFQMLHKLFPEHYSLIQKMQEACSEKPDTTQKTRSLSSQYLKNVIKMVESLQGTSQDF